MRTRAFSKASRIFGVNSFNQFSKEYSSKLNSRQKIFWIKKDSHCTNFPNFPKLSKSFQNFPRLLQNNKIPSKFSSHKHKKPQSVVKLLHIQSFSDVLLLVRQLHLVFEAIRVPLKDS